MTLVLDLPLARDPAPASALRRARAAFATGLRFVVVVLPLVLAAPGALAAADEPDHAIHEELRAMLQQIEKAIGAGQYDQMLPLLDENIRATSVTQEVMSSRADVAAYFKEWFGPQGYMKSMTMKLEPDALTELAPDKRWGLVRGKAREHYEAKDGDQFDFATRWTAIVAPGDDGRWRVRAIHFGTNHLDNPVLTKVRNTLVRYGIIGGLVALLVGVAAGWKLRGARAKAAVV